MKTIIAENSGFCPGVERAVNTALEQPKGTKVLGQIVHNPVVDEQLQKSGIVRVEDPNEIKEGDRVIIRAHGALASNLAELRERHVDIIDCTCRKVKRIQRTAHNLEKKGTRIAVFGKGGHPEFESICSFAGENVVRLGSMNEVRALTESFEELTLLAQTTTHPDDFQIAKEVLQKKAAALDSPDTLCSFTKKAVESALQVAKQVDMMIVIGGRNSSNTTNLVLKCIEAGVRTHHIEKVEDLADINFTRIKSVGITAGASTPESTIQAAREALESR